MNSSSLESDVRLFWEAVEDAERLASEQAEPFRRRPAPVPIEQPPELRDAEPAVALSESEVDTPEFLLFVRPGVQRRLIHDLQRGYLEVELEVDLHGLTVPFAERLLGEFLDECQRRRVRCARIIHGKGSRSAEGPPVLKRKVNYWLRLRKEVLAFASAMRRDGGTGALYVLLRNPNKGRGGRGRWRTT
jgi:DNA-nicking Smr family endonuclease